MFVRIFYTRFFFIAKWWYRLTQWVTGIIFPTTAVAPVDEPLNIANRLDWGKDYKLDPLKGLLDAFTHPAVLQHRIENDEKLGDCDDHAGYWVSCLLRSKLAQRAWIGCVFYEGHDGKQSGHAVAVWRDILGKMWWADYGEPAEFRGRHEWVNQVVLGTPPASFGGSGRRGYGVRPTVFATMEITGVSSTGKLRFGPTSGHVWEP